MCCIGTPKATEKWKQKGVFPVWKVAMVKVHTRERELSLWGRPSAYSDLRLYSPYVNEEIIAGVHSARKLSEKGAPYYKRDAGVCALHAYCSEEAARTGGWLTFYAEDKWCPVLLRAWSHGKYVQAVGYASGRKRPLDFECEEEIAVSRLWYSESDLADAKQRAYVALAELLLKLKGCEYNVPDEEMAQYAATYL